MDTNDFRLLYDFNAWANHRTLDTCSSLAPEQFTRDLGSSFRSLRDTLAHIYGAEWIWLERWQGRVAAGLPSAADFPDFESIRKRLTEMDSTLVDYVAGLTHGGCPARGAVQDDGGRGVLRSHSGSACSTSPITARIIADRSRPCCASSARSPSATDLICFYRERAAQATA